MIPLMYIIYNSPHLYNKYMIPLTHHLYNILYPSHLIPLYESLFTMHGIKQIQIIKNSGSMWTLFMLHNYLCYIDKKIYRKKFISYGYLSQQNTVIICLNCQDKNGWVWTHNLLLMSLTLYQWAILNEMDHLT